LASRVAARADSDSDFSVAVFLTVGTIKVAKFPFWASADLLEDFGEPTAASR
jgi:hypothetical protein